MMLEFKSVKLPLLLTLMLQFTETQRPIISVRVGHDVTLPCKDAKDLPDNCFSTTWLYTDSKKSVTLFEYGTVHKDAGVKSVRLRVKKNCFLVLEKVTAEDEGLYTCRQFRSGKQVTDSGVQLSVRNETKTKTKKKTEKTPSSSAAPTMSSSTTAKHGTTTAGIPLVVSAVVVTAVIIVVVTVIKWKKMNERKRQMDHNNGRTADAEVIYSTIGPHPSPAAGSDDPNHLYSQIQYI
ncbi:uncharacterized protein LOC133418371 isoform X2 [Cololabis saira]|uniref:uncharacterized protein LOC133418371 isoform X2 n=1 Tax=Cololabis saira TaxID=129043 RepID=UPI002AD4B2D0|nr:uncharacterized protein LOC133418371 isoform X2 [Cololabis saira]